MGLGAFVIKRLASMILVIIGVTLITFFLVHLAPGDPIRIALGIHASGQSVSQLEHQYGLDQPLPIQYLNYMAGLVQGRLGPSYESPDFTVNDILGRGLPITLWLGLWATVIAIVVGLPLGVLAAVRHNKLLSDNLNMAGNMILYSVPPLLLIGVARVIFSIDLHWLPVAGWNGFTSVQYLAMPVLIYASGIVGFYARSMRSFMLEVLNQQYIRTAKAKGLAYWKIVFVHAAKNTLVPFASILGPTIAFLVVGAFIIENLFNIPGIAQITVQSTLANDYNVTLATTVLLALAVVVVNALTDIFYALVDPRVRL
ncbi:MAG TPA: ABC transporter permease [Chloroflexota bacterium]|nr:ABC transporter permease [Chloroflexota bacterium]